MKSNKTISTEQANLLAQKLGYESFNEMIAEYRTKLFEASKTMIMSFQNKLSKEDMPAFEAILRESQWVALKGLAVMAAVENALMPSTTVFELLQEYEYAQSKVLGELFFKSFGLDEEKENDEKESEPKKVEETIERNVPKEKLN